MAQASPFAGSNRRPVPPKPEPSLKPVTSVVIALAVATSLGAQTPPTPLRLDLPLFDAPCNPANGLRGPSMAQSLAVGETFYELSHTSIQRAWGRHTKLAGVSLVLFDVFGGLLPGGEGW